MRTAGEQATPLGARQMRAVPRPRAGRARQGPRRSRPRRVRLGRGAVDVRRRGSRGPEAEAALRARRDGEGRPLDAVGQLPPEPAEHVHRPADRDNAGCGAPTGPETAHGGRLMPQRTHEADIAAVTETVRAYYDGSMAGDAAMLGRAFHPRASIVGHEHGALQWASLDDYIAECEGAVGVAGPHEWRIEAMSLVGDT